MPSPLRHTEIALAAMRFHVLVGILPHERIVPQPLEVDLRVGLHPDGDALVDYRALYALVHDAVTAGPLEYLEPLAGLIVTHALALHGVAWARVAVRKPHVALDGPLAYAEVAIEGSNE